MPTRQVLKERLTAAGVAFRELAAAAGGWAGSWAGSWALIAPELGAKVVGAGVDEENLLWVPHELKRGDWCVGGVRTWLAPEIGSRAFFGTAEADWGVDPVLDPGQYRPIPAPPWAPRAGALWFRNDLAARRTDGSTLQLSLLRGVALEPFGRGLRLILTHALVNREERPLEQEVGLWGIVQVPSEQCGTILIPLTSGAGRESLRPYFGAVPDGWVRGAPGMVCLKALAGTRYKVGVPPQHAAGLLALLRPSRLPSGGLQTLVVLRAAVDRAGRYLDGPPLAGPGDHGADDNGDVLQCYNSPDARTLAFSELEAHAPAAHLRRGEIQQATLELLLHKDGQTGLLDRLHALGLGEGGEANLFRG